MQPPLLKRAVSKDKYDRFSNNCLTLKVSTMKFRYTTYLTVILLFASCTNNLDVDVVKPVGIAKNDISVLSETEYTVVSKTQALSVAGKFQNLPKTRSEGEKDADVQTIFDENNTPLM